MTTKLSSSYSKSQNHPRLTETKTAPTPTTKQIETNQKAKNSFNQVVNSTSTVPTIQLTGVNAPATNSKTNYIKAPTIVGNLMYKAFEDVITSQGLTNPFTNPEEIKLLSSIFEDFAKGPFDLLHYFIIESINLEWNKIPKEHLKSDVILSSYISSFNNSFLSFSQKLFEQNVITLHCKKNEQQELQKAINNKENTISAYRKKLEDSITLIQGKLEKESKIINKHKLLLTLVNDSECARFLNLNIKIKLSQLAYEADREMQKLDQQHGVAEKSSHRPYNQKSNTAYSKEDARLGGDLITLPINHIRLFIDYYKKSTPEDLKNLIAGLQSNQSNSPIQQPHLFLENLVKDLIKFQGSPLSQKKQIAQEILEKIEQTTSKIKENSVLNTSTKEIEEIQRDTAKNRPERIKRLLVLGFYFDTLDNLKDYLKNTSFQQDLLYASIRTYDNIHSLVTLNEGMFEEELQPFLKSFLKEIKGFHFYKELNAFFRDHQGFDLSSTGPAMTLILEKINPLHIKSLLFSLKKFHGNASKRAEELQKARKQDEAEKLAAEYTEACYKTLMPLFLISQDIKNMNPNNSSDPKELLIPAEIFDFVYLELNITKIEPAVSDESPEELEPAPVEPAPPQAPSKIKQKQAISPTKIVKVTKVVSEPNDVRELKPGRNETMKEWTKRIKKELGLVLVTGGRHMHLEGPDGTKVTPVPFGKGGNQTVPLGTASSMANDVKSYLSEKQQKKKK